METEQRAGAGTVGFGMLVLGIDTCGPTGSVALGRLAGRDLEIVRQIELEGRSYSATLVAAVGELLRGAGVGLKDVGGIVAVNGPGSFTGVRVGLSAVKGLAEGGQIPVVAVSRLEVLSMKARELLVGAREFAAMDATPLRIAVCDDGAAGLLEAAWPSTQLVRSAAPVAADALRMGEARLVAGALVDLALLDGHYLRRSDAEIFGAETHSEAAGVGRERA
jgi:tRNA threonylcarbamoyladenosine biosynthesis protein TsaB